MQQNKAHFWNPLVQRHHIYGIRISPEQDQVTPRSIEEWKAGKLRLSGISVK